MVRLDVLISMSYILIFCVKKIDHDKSHKKLPSWLREGLEKINQEKQKKLDSNQAKKFEAGGKGLAVISFFFDTQYFKHKLIFI